MKLLTTALLVASKITILSANDIFFVLVKIFDKKIKALQLKKTVCIYDMGKSHAHLKCCIITLSKLF